MISTMRALKKYTDTLLIEIRTVLNINIRFRNFVTIKTVEI